jgi:acetyl-CoA carboxylase carboxyltransferase component
VIEMTDLAIEELEAALARPAAPPTLDRRTAELAALKATITSGPDAAAAGRQHAKGKLTARERIELLLDPGSFHEIGAIRRHRAVGFGLEQRRPYTDGVITGWGTVFDRKVFVYAQDASVFGGALGEAHADKIHKIMDLAIAAGCPLVGINDGGGARIQEGVTALAGYGGIFRRHVAASGVIPQISVVVGACAGGAAYSPALTDFVFVVRKTAKMFITGPEVVAAVTGEQVDMDELGGADIHAGTSGVASFIHNDEPSCLADVRYLLAFLPSSNREPVPSFACSDPVNRQTDELLRIVPADPRKPYDVRSVIAEIVDDGEFMEVHECWAGNVVCALARIAGSTVGIVANQPLVQAGALDISASEKAARFVGMCDAFGIPLLTLVDVPGFLPGVCQEHRGIIRHGAKLLYAYCNASVPRVQLILRKAYGGAYIVMDARSIGSDLSYAWPTNEVAVMGAEAAANVVFRREIAAARDPDAARAERIQEYRDKLMHPYHAAERGLVDEVIDPRHTRKIVANAFATLRGKPPLVVQRRHGNHPA